MQTLLLLAVAAAIFVLGWFLMKRLDCFFENNRRLQAAECLSGKNTLQIGLSNPAAADCIANILEQYSKIDDNISFRIFYGTEDELIKGFIVNKLDMVFLPENLPENIDIPVDVRYNVKKVLLSCAPVIMKYGGLPIEPIAHKNIVQNILYAKETKASPVSHFAEYILEKLAVCEA